MPKSQNEFCGLTDILKGFLPKLGVYLAQIRIFLIQSPLLLSFSEKADLPQQIRFSYFYFKCKAFAMANAT